jgi:O-antigen/teichoic acid export membrane protein
LGEIAARIPRLATNYIVLSAGEAIAKVLAAVAFAHLARVLGPQRYGYLEFAIAVILFYTLIADMGLNAYLAREIARDKAAATRLAAHSIVIRCLLVAAVLPLLAVSVSVLPQPPLAKRLTLLYGLTLLGQPGLVQGVFQGLDRMHYVALASVIRWTIFAAGVFLFVRAPEQVWAVPIIEGCAILALAAFYVWNVSHVLGSLRQRIDGTLAASMFRQALPIGASDLVWALQIYSGTVLLGLLIGGPQVGWFGAAHRLVISLHTFVWLYFLNLLPSMARCSQRPIETLQLLLQKSMKVTAWAAVFLGIVGTALAEPLMTLVYGGQYREATTVFQWLVWLIPLRLLYGHYGYALIAYDKQQLAFLSAASGAGLTLLLNLLLVPAYGAVGAAWALVSSDLVAGVLAYYLMRRTVVRIPVWSHMPRPLLAGALLIGLLPILRKADVLVTVGSASVVYGLILLIIQPEVFKDVRSMFMRDR